VLVAVREGTDPSSERLLVEIAADLAAPQHGRVSVVRFDEVADHVPLDHAATTRSAGDLRFEERTDAIAVGLDVPVRIGEIVSHDTRRALANHVRDGDPDVLVMEREPEGLRSRLFTSDADWVLAHTDCDAVLVDHRATGTPGRTGLGDLDAVAVLTDEGPYDPAKIAVADAIATAHDATITLEYSVEGFASEEQRRTISGYHDEIAALCSAPVHTGFVLPDGGTAAFEDRDTDLLVVGTGAAALADAVDCPALVVRPREETTPGSVVRILERLLL
jgi:hypothetical protein